MLIRLTRAGWLGATLAALLAAACNQEMPPSPNVDGAPGHGDAGANNPDAAASAGDAAIGSDAGPLPDGGGCPLPDGGVDAGPLDPDAGGCPLPDAGLADASSPDV